MEENIGWAIIGVFFLIIIISMAWKIRNNFMKYSKKGLKDRRKKLKLSTKDFFNSDGSSNRSYAAVLSMIFIVLFLFVGAFFAAILPVYVTLTLCIITGITFLIYFIRMVIDTAKSIKKEKFRTTLKIRWNGVLSLFIFLLWLYAYVSSTSGSGF